MSQFAKVCSDLRSFKVYDPKADIHIKRIHFINDNMINADNSKLCKNFSRKISTIYHRYESMWYSFLCSSVAKELTLQRCDFAPKIP